MRPVTVRLLTFAGCPLAPQARARVSEVIGGLDPGLHIDFQELDIEAPDTPDDYTRWGSPTILINGRDMTGAQPGAATCCRVYFTRDGVPDTAHIIKAIKEAATGNES